MYNRPIEEILHFKNPQEQTICLLAHQAESLRRIADVLEKMNKPPKQETRRRCSNESCRRHNERWNNNCDKREDVNKCKDAI